MQAGDAATDGPGGYLEKHLQSTYQLPACIISAARLRSTHKENTTTSQCDAWGVVEVSRQLALRCPAPERPPTQFPTLPCTNPSVNQHPAPPPGTSHIKEEIILVLSPYSSDKGKHSTAAV